MSSNQISHVWECSIDGHEYSLRIGKGGQEFQIYRDSFLIATYNDKLKTWIVSKDNIMFMFNWFNFKDVCKEFEFRFNTVGNTEPEIEYSRMK